jgi:death-on-curing family protein
MIKDLQTRSGIVIKSLTTDCVIHLHELLTDNALLIGADPVEPPGVKNQNMLESAIMRQQTGSGSWYKYDNIYTNCATLVYGINKNHGFHNGNKRVSFLAMIKHLYSNGYVLKPEVTQNDIYKLLLAVADKEGSIYEFAKQYSTGKKDKSKNIFHRVGKNRKWNAEDEVQYIGFWLKESTVSKNIQLKYKVKLTDLRRILEPKGIIMETNGNHIILKTVETKKLWFGLSTKNITVKQKEYNLGNSISEINQELVAQIRREFNLTISDGIDNIAFYDEKGFLDEQIINHKKLIYRLSKT